MRSRLVRLTLAAISANRRAVNCQRRTAMPLPEPAYPQFPPGFWRRIMLHPGEGWIAGAIEDDMHHFRLRLEHRDGVIVAAQASAVRHPWTGCGGAPGHIIARLTGERLADVAQRDPMEHCTHLFDLALLMAAHASDSAPTRFDMRVADRIAGRSTATLAVNGEERLHLKLEGTVIAAPARFAGLDLKRVSQWKHDFDAQTAELAVILRRAVFVAGARGYTMRPGLEGPQSPLAKHAPCFNYRSPVVETTRSLYEAHDFSSGDREPLQDLDFACDFIAS
jgi:Protein of unknown function (DUF2889)